MMNNALSHQGLKDQKENIKEKAMARKVNIAKCEKKNIQNKHSPCSKICHNLCVFKKKIPLKTSL